ncbi:MAG TPA: hypothetical protein DCP28_24875, partial [Cytophagales bacterium]|nr:hypothetical protein [Cytophagales bacterium]
MKKPISILLLGLVGLVTTSALVISPHEFLENLRQLWQDRQQSQHEERLYLHTDKSLYEPGEVIWINAMLLNRADHTPTTLSDVVHLKLFDPRGQQIDSTAVVVHDGTAKADFQLSSQRPGGLYELRGYTRWMLNEGEDAYFSKRLTVLKTETPRLLMKLDFEREGYGERDTVVAQLKVRSLAGEAAAGATVYANWILRGSMVQKDTLFLDANGEVNLSLLLSDMEQNTVGLLNAVVDFQGTQESISRRIPIPSGSVSIAFFPEGGRYVAGVPARLGFKAVDTYQKGVEVSGEIRTAEGQTVASFESYHQGMGAVAFTPTPNQRYYAHIQKPFPQPRQALPEADMEGWVLRYDTTKVGAAHFVVHSQAADTAHVVAHSLGVLRYSQALPLQAGVTRFNIPLDSFPRGTAVFTLWDADTRLPMCERLVFLDHQKELRVHLETDKPHYQPREEIQVKVRTTDSEGNPVSARLSMAAVDEQVLSFADDKQDNLLTYMLLSSEVKGKIEEPSFYLNPEEPKATMARDYLLMTQGWRGFSYESLWSPIPVVTYPAEQETTINGRLLLSDFRRGAQGTVYLIEQGGKNRMLPVRTTPAGYFSFRNLDPTILNILAVRKPLIPGMLNDGQVTVQAPTESRRSGGRFTPIWESTIPNPEGVAVATNEATPGPSLPEDEFADAMTLEPDVQNLDEVVVVALSTGAQRQDLTGSISLISNEYSHLGSQGASNLLAGSAAGIQIRGTSSFSHTASIYGSRAVGMDGPLLIIDGLPVAPENRDQMLSLLGTEGQKIEAISVLQGLQATQIYGSRATGGVIVISTSDRNPKQPLFDLAPRYNTLLLYPKYYRVMREFYPVTALKEDADGLNRLAQDRRTTLYWDPSVTTNEQGEATLTFRAGDKESSFALSAEGFTSQGDLGKGETTFGVGLPLSIDVKLPAFLSVNDTLRASVQLRNRTQDTLTTQFSVGAPPEVYQVSGVPTGPLVIPPQQSIAVPVQVYVPTYQAPHSRRVESQRRFSRGVRYEYIRRELAFRVASEKYQDSLRLPLPLRQTGFPRYVSQTSSEPHHIYAFDLVTPEVSTIRATFRANSDVLSQMLGTLEATRSRP